MNAIERLFEATGKSSIAIYVPTPQASIQLQNYLFTLGYRWISGRQPLHTNSNCIHIYKYAFSLTYSHIGDTQIRSTIMYHNIVPNLIKLH